MNTTFELDVDDSTEAKREIIRQSLDKITVDITNGLRQANLNYPLYICIPSSGHAVVSIMTPLDPSNEDWCHISDIVRGIISEYLDGLGLRSVELPCTMVNVAVEIIGD
jgi:hypothetical protein